MKVRKSLHDNEKKNIMIIMERLNTTFNVEINGKTNYIFNLRMQFDNGDYDI